MSVKASAAGLGSLCQPLLIKPLLFSSPSNFDLYTHLRPHLLQGAKGGDVGVCHRPRDRDPEKDTSLDVTGEVKA